MLQRRMEDRAMESLKYVTGTNSSKMDTSVDERWRSYRPSASANEATVERVRELLAEACSYKRWLLLRKRSLYCTVLYFSETKLIRGTL